FNASFVTFQDAVIAKGLAIDNGFGCHVVSPVAQFAASLPLFCHPNESLSSGSAKSVILFRPCRSGAFAGELHDTVGTVEIPAGKCGVGAEKAPLRSVGRSRKRLVGQLAFDDLFECDVRKRHARRRFDQRSMSQAKLTHALGDHINQQLLIRDHPRCLLEKLSSHMSRRTNGSFLRKWKDGRQAASQDGWDKLLGEHVKKMSADILGKATACQLRKR